MVRPFLACFGDHQGRSFALFFPNAHPCASPTALAVIVCPFCGAKTTLMLGSHGKGVAG